MMKVSRGHFAKLLMAVSALLALRTQGLAAPVIEDVVQSQSKIYVIGNGFDSKERYIVDFGGATAKLINVSPTIITVELPSDAAIGIVSATDSKGAVTKSAKPYAFTLSTITDFIPKTGKAGTTVVIRGTNFDPVRSRNVVYFSEAEANIISGDQTLLVVTVPNDAKTGPITWNNKNFGAVTKSQINFEVEPSGEPPAITGFTPDRGPVGTVLIIKGKNLGTATKVVFKDDVAAKISTVSPAEIRVVVPNNAKDGSITVATANGDVVSVNHFTVTSPQLTFEPRSGVKGSKIKIFGTAFEQKNDISFNGIPAESIDVEVNYNDLPPTKVIAIVPDAAAGQSGPITVTNSKGTFVSSCDFTVLGPQRAIHLYGGSTVNFFKKSADGTAADVQPLVGLVGIHKFAACPLFELGRDCGKDGEWLSGLDLTYRGVTAEKADVTKLATAKGVGLFLNTYYSALRGDTFTFGPSAMGGYEFLTEDDFRHDAQYSYGFSLRVQDHEDPLFFGQLGYGNTEYLTHNRFLVEGSVPLLTTLIGSEGKATSFYDKNFTDFYFFINANISLDRKKDDSFIFGIKGVMAASRLMKLFDPNSVVADKDQVKETAK